MKFTGPRSGEAVGSAMARSARRLILALACATAAWPGAGFAKEGPACSGRDMRAVVAETEPGIDAQIKARVAAMPFAKGTLFRLSKPGIPPSTVLGTIHLLDTERVELPKPVLEAFDEAEVLALELKEIGTLDDPEAVIPLLPKILPLAVAKPPQSLAALLPAESVSGIEAALKERRLPAAFARTFKPSFVSAVLGMPSCILAAGRGRKGVDKWLAAEADDRDMPVVGLETLDEQLRVLLGQSAQFEAAVAKSMARDLDRQTDMFVTTQRSYADGDIGWLVAVYELQSTEAGDHSASAQAYLKSLLLDRNHVMHERSKPLVEKGHAMIAVGAAHLPGEEGLLRLYERDGYRVERLY